ncbi:MAG: hydroxymethylglutaryl-CoA lyase [Phycisphaerales bacterium]|nr:hydroxymethylglutaryl-CoA lyase [Phycisphaerales bacterium]
MPNYVRITDVSPRDGLQNEPGTVPTADKLALIGHLVAAGVDEVEATSFVSSKWIPQLADAPQLVERLAYLWSSGEAEGAPEPWPELAASDLPCEFSALVPNQEGLSAFVAANINPLAPDIAGGPLGKASIFTAASETFARKNTNASIAETIARFEPVVSAAHQRSLVVRGYISCAIACPFEGPTAPEKVAEAAIALSELGVDELDLADTIGVATPDQIELMLAAVLDVIGDEWLEASPEGYAPGLTLHLHDTQGRAAACIKRALEVGVRSFDSAVAGIGGCPYASTPSMRAPGNIATELLVKTIREAGFESSIDLDRLAIAAAFARSIVERARVGAASVGGGGAARGSGQR